MVVGGWVRFGGRSVSSSDCETLKLASESCYRLWTLAVVLVRGRCHRLRPCGHVSLYLVMYTAQMRDSRRMQPSGSRGRAEERLKEGKAKYTKSVAVAEKCGFGREDAASFHFTRYFINSFHLPSPYLLTHLAMAAIPKHRQLPDKENKLFRELLVRATTTLPHPLHAEIPPADTV